MKTILILLCTVLLTGCAVIKHGDTFYARLGDQKLDGVTITLDPDGVSTLSFDKQESDFALGFKLGAASVQIGGD